jgi:pimeloyl-ACP methyl ester carboxylesterase
MVVDKLDSQSLSPAAQLTREGSDPGHEGATDPAPSQTVHEDRVYPGRPPANQPMRGAFSGQTSQIRAPQPAVAWSGPRVDAATLGEGTEQRILRTAGRDCVIAAFSDFRVDRPPVVLVHGINGSADDLTELAERLQRQGKQVLIAFYSDRRNATHESGQALAQELVRIREAHYRPGTHLDIVAHSMGGVVTRAALNELQNPAWMGETTDASANPRAGFGDMRVRTVDTPWDGFDHAPEIPILGPIVRALTKLFMTLFGWLGAFEMQGNSRMFQKLYDQPLDRVGFRNYAARQPGPQDRIRALPDLDAEELDQVAWFVAHGQRPTSHRARNMALALAQDNRFARLRRELRAANAAGPAAQRENLVSTYERVMPRFVGSHTSVLRDGDGFDLVDRIVADLR